MNGPAAGHMPSERFTINATWLKLANLSYNIISAIKGLCLSPEERTARFQEYRLLLVHVAGRMHRNNCVMRLRLCVSEQTIARFSAVWKVFWQPWPRAALRLARPPFSFSHLTSLPILRRHRHVPRTGLPASAVASEWPAASSWALFVASRPAKSGRRRLAPLPEALRRNVPRPAGAGPPAVLGEDFGETVVRLTVTVEWPTVP